MGTSVVIFTRVSNGWVRVTVGSASVTLTPKDWAQVVKDMGEAEKREGLAPT